MSRGAVVLGTLVVIFWIGSAVIPVSKTEAESASIEPRNVQSKKDDAQKAASEQTIRTFKADDGTGRHETAKGSADSVKEDFPPIFSAKRVNDPEPVFLCGARTKKGTACTRRVKEAGKRCWQHQGMPAMKDEKPPSELDF